MTDEVQPQMAIQLIVEVVRAMCISFNCLLALHFFIPACLHYFFHYIVADQYFEIHLLYLMCTCQEKTGLYTLVAYIKHFNFFFLQFFYTYYP